MEQEMLLVLLLTLRNLLEHPNAVPVARPDTLHSFPSFGIHQVLGVYHSIHCFPLFIRR